VPCRAREGKPSRATVAIQFSLYGVQHEWNVLILIDEHRHCAADEKAGIGRHRFSRREIIEIQDLGAPVVCQLAQQRGLADRAGPLQQDHWLVGHPVQHERK